MNVNELNEKPDDSWLLEGMCHDWPTLPNQFLHLHIFHLTILPDTSEMPYLSALCYLTGFTCSHTKTNKSVCWLCP